MCKPAGYWIITNVHSPSLFNSVDVLHFRRGLKNLKIMTGIEGGGSKYSELYQCIIHVLCCRSEQWCWTFLLKLPSFTLNDKPGLMTLNGLNGWDRMNMADKINE